MTFDFENYIKTAGRKGAELRAHCPFHKDRTPSFSANIETGFWICHSGCGSGNYEQFLGRLGLKIKAELPVEVEKEKFVKISEYIYEDISGFPALKVERFESLSGRKSFIQKHLVGSIWQNGAPKVRVPPYHYGLWRDVTEESIFLVEGEKCAETLCAIGQAATTTPGGSNGWRKEDASFFQGKEVVILPDNDLPGAKYAEIAFRDIKPVAKSVKIVQLPGLNIGEDIVEWIAKGNGIDDLIRLAEKSVVLSEIPSNGLQAPKFNITRLDKLLNEPEEKVNWILDQILPTAGTSLLVGKPKVGKTTLVRNLLICISQGKPFLGRQTQKGAVLYLALEEKRSEVIRHFKEMNVSGQEEVYLHAAVAPPEALDLLREELSKKEFALIVIDPLFRLVRIRDGNDYIQVTNALEPLVSLARTSGAHILCVHHLGKGEREGADAILGSTAIFGAVDTAVILKRTEKYRTLKTTQRYGLDLEETVLNFDTNTRTVLLGESKSRVERKNLSENILEVIQRAGHPITGSEIEEQVEGRTQLKREALKWLIEDKQVERTGRGGKGDPYKYSCSRVPTLYPEQGNKNE